MPASKKTPKRTYYPKALRAELEAMRARWQANGATAHFTLGQLHALVELERTWKEPEQPGWYPRYYRHEAELQALFDATHPRYTMTRAQLHFAMKSNSSAISFPASSDM